LQAQPAQDEDRETYWRGLQHGRESGDGEQTIMDIAGYISRDMLKHYSHIRKEAKRDALESLVAKPVERKPLARVRKGTPNVPEAASIA
jgi:hypothetical protein